MKIFYSFRVFLVRDVSRDRIHRSRPVQRDPGDDILKAVRSQFLHEPRHTGRFQLEHTLRIAGRYHFEHFRIIKIHIVKIYIDAVSFLYEIKSIPYYRYVSEPQKVHLEQAQFFKSILFELSLDDISVAVQRHIIIDSPL